MGNSCSKCGHGWRSQPDEMGRYLVWECRSCGHRAVFPNPGARWPVEWRGQR